MTDPDLAMDLSLAMTIERDCKIASAPAGTQEAKAIELAARHATALKKALESWIGLRAVAQVK